MPQGPTKGELEEILDDVRDLVGTRITKDGFGRTIKTETGTTSGNPPAMATALSVVDTVYDSCGCSPIGKMKQVSQPHVPNGTTVYTAYNYDGLLRTISTVAADGSTTHYAYAGNTVTVTDPTNKWKKFMMDAFGNLVRVDEQGSNAIATYYTYDVLTHLTQVAMWTSQPAVQYRTFNYTSNNTVGGLLLSATNPESGTVTYTYNTNLSTVANNMPITKQDARLAATGSQLYRGCSTTVLNWDEARPFYPVLRQIPASLIWFIEQNGTNWQF